MKANPPTRKLRERPDLDQLRRQAKELLAAFIAGDPAAAAEVGAHYRDAGLATFALHDAQLVLARSYGFASWPKLKAYVDGATAQRLCEAVKGGDIAQVHAMLKVRPELTNRDLSENNEHRALHYAVLARAPEMVRILMQHGADARKGIYPHRDATRALTIAAERGYSEIVAIIDEEEQRRRAAAAGSNAPPNPGAKDSEADELNAAILHGDEARAIATLEANPALVHATDRYGWPPLHVAAATLSEQVVGWLLDNGADPNPRSTCGLSPLDMLGRRSRTGEHLAAIADRLLQRGAERTPRWAVVVGETDWLRARHADGKLSVPPGSEGLLSIAVKHDRPEVIALLLELGFDPDERTRVEGLEEVVYTWGMPLQHCAESGKLAMAKMLLEHGADPNGEVYAAGTAVSTAYRKRDAAMLELLQRHGGILRAETAGYHRDTELAKRMLEAEAAGKLPPQTVAPGRTVAEDLIHGDCGEPEILRMALERIDWPRNDPRWHSILCGPLSFWNHIPWVESEKWDLDRSAYLTCFRLILERCHANVSGTYGRTILHDVVAMGRREGVRDWITEDEVAAFAKTLLDAGARLDVRDDLLKSTPLGWACRWGRAKLVKLMLERGADPVEAEAEEWARPLAWANKSAREDIAALLQEYAQGKSRSEPRA